MAKIFTTNKEEILIANIISNGLGFSTSEIHKYAILRLGINIALKLDFKPLSDEEFYSEHVLYGEQRGKEYALETITSKGQDLKDYDELLRLIFAFKHKDENLNFNDDEIFAKALKKYINRGLFELDKIYKNRDDFYQILIDNIKLYDSKKENRTQNIAYNSFEKQREELLKYFKDNDIKAEILDENINLRYNNYKLKFYEIKDKEKLSKDLDNLKPRFGLLGEAKFDYANESMTYYLSLPRKEKEWKKFDFEDFKNDLEACNIKGLIKAYIGRNLLGEPEFFDLNSCPHLLIGGTTGSGKSVFLNALILSIMKLNENIEFILIDPKGGASFNPYYNFNKLSPINDKQIITSASGAKDILEILVEEMEMRNQKIASYGVSQNSELENPFENIIVVIDELADLFNSDERIEKQVIRLAQKARSSGIYLITATQTPNSQILSQTLRANLPGKAALKVTTAAQSKVILDEVGAEKLLGKGDLLFKSPQNEINTYFTPLIKNSDIREI